MDTSETVQFIDAIKAVSPQPFNDAAPAIWSAVLADVPLADAMAVLAQVVARHTFVAPSDIVKGVRAIRHERWQAFTYTVETNVAADDQTGWDSRERRAIREAVMSGEMTAAGYRAYRDSGRTITPAPGPGYRAVLAHRCVPESQGRCPCGGSGRVVVPGA